MTAAARLLRDHVRSRPYPAPELAELSIKRALFGYRRRDVDALVAARDAELELRMTELRVHCARIGELEAVADRLTVQVVDRERELRGVREDLAQAVAGREEGLGLVDSLSRRVEELHAQARGQATRIRLAALSDAAELSSRLQAAVPGAARPAAPSKGIEVPIRRVAPRVQRQSDIAAEIEGPFVLGRNGSEGNRAGTTLAGSVRIDVGPLADFAQLIRIEDAVREIEAATEISIKRFSGGRATLSVHLGEPTELLRELEERSELEFEVRRAGADELVLDLGDSIPGE